MTDKQILNILRDVSGIPRREPILDTSNRFLVTASHEVLMVRRAVAGRWLSKDDALNLAAWLVALADPEGREFEAMHKGVLER